MAGSVVPLLTLGSLPGLEFTVTKHPPALSQGTSLKFFPHLAGIGVPPPQPGINPALPAVQLHPRRWGSAGSGPPGAEEAGDEFIWG